MGRRGTQREAMPLATRCEALKNNCVLSNKRINMTITTTPNIEGKQVSRYLGVVTGETIFGMNVVRDFFASIRDIVGGRAKSYEEVLARAKDEALAEMTERAKALGANAILSVSLDYESIGGSGSMLMVTCSGTAVWVE